MTGTELRGGNSFSLKEHGIDTDILRGKNISSNLDAPLPPWEKGGFK